MNAAPSILASAAVLWRHRAIHLHEADRIVRAHTTLDNHADAWQLFEQLARLVDRYGYLHPSPRMEELIDQLTITPDDDAELLAVASAAGVNTTPTAPALTVVRPQEG